MRRAAMRASGLMSSIRSRITSTLGRPSVERSAISWRLRFEGQTTSSSKQVDRADARADQRLAGKPPTPPTPNSATRARERRSTASAPIIRSVRSRQSSTRPPPSALNCSHYRGKRGENQAGGARSLGFFGEIGLRGRRISCKIEGVRRKRGAARWKTFCSTVNIVFPIFLVMAVGYFCRHSGMLNAEDIVAMNRVSFGVFLPASLCQQPARSRGPARPSARACWHSGLPARSWCFCWRF